MEFVKLNNGVEMPMEGFGVFQVPDHKECKQSVIDAVRSGYRLIDTAAAYMNEEAVGEAIKELACGGEVKREELFITTKLWVQDASYEAAKQAFERSIKKLGVDYLDLYLIHQAMGDYYGAWRAMEELYEEGKIRAIGVCNFFPARLMDLCMHCKVTPMVNQVELHPFFQQPDALATMKELGVQPEAWGPFAEGRNNIFSHPVLSEIGAKYGKTAAQVALRWNIDRGVVVIPKSVHKDRIEQNFNLWDFKLDSEDMEKIAALDLGHSEIINHFDPAVIKMIGGLKVHD